MFSYIGGFFCSIFCSLPLYPLQKLKISVHTFKWFPPQIPSLIFEGGEWQRSSEYRKLPKREPFQLDLPRCLLLGRIAMRKLDSLLKSRDITLLTKVHIVKAMVFPVVMYRCEGWTIRLSAKELMLSNCGAGKIPNFLGQQGDQTCQS